MFEEYGGRGARVECEVRVRVRVRARCDKTTTVVRAAAVTTGQQCARQTCISSASACLHAWRCPARIWANIGDIRSNTESYGSRSI